MSDPAGSGGEGGLFLRGRGASAPEKPQGGLEGLALGAKNVPRRWVYVGGGAAVLAIAASLALQDEPAPRRAKPSTAADPVIDATPKGEGKKSFEAQYGQELEAFKAEVKRLSAEAQSQQQELKTLREQLGNRQGTNTGGLGLPAAGSVPPPPVPPNSIRGGQPQPSIPVPALPPAAQVPALPPQVAPAPTPTQLPSPIAPAPAPVKREPLVFEAPGATSEAGSVGTKTSYVKNPNAGAFSLGFVPITLLNGLDAGTSQVTQANPMPVLMNVTDHMTLPGLDRYRMKNCFLLGAGYGELSAERVYIRVSRISCVDKSNKLAVTAEVTGVVNDSDGKLGLRGLVVDRQGAKVGKAVLSGFAQGLTQALAQGQGTVTSSAVTGLTTSTLQGSAVARAAGLTGAQTAAQQLADFYLKEAQSIFPVISIDAGRLATVMFTGTTRLTWQPTDVQYVQNVTPTDR